MENQELIHCLEVLRKEPSWFFQRPDTEQKLKCLETFGEKGSPQNIVFLFDFLTGSNSVLRNAVAETIIALFHKLRTQAEFYTSLRYIKLETADLNYHKTVFSPPVYLQLLFIASLNQSGYVREKAVTELAETKNPEAIKFIIFRLGDWVENVREAAKKAVRDFFQPIFIDEFLSQLTLIDWLLKVQRTDLSEIYSEIYNFIFSFQFDKIFFRRLNEFNDKTKLLYVRNYLNSNAVRENIFELLAADKLYSVKVELLKHIEKLNAETQKLFVKKFLRDRSAKVRTYSLYATKPFKAEFTDAILELIFDISAPVRELARFILKDSSIDFAELYREKLKQDENSIGAILGLSEVGTETDLPIFEKYVYHPKYIIRLACLYAANRLNKMSARIYAMNFLADSNSKVRNKSVEILSKFADDEVLGRARDIFQNGDYEQKKTVLKLFTQIKGWKTVGDFILALSDSNEDIQNLGWMCLGKWISTQLFTKPCSEDTARIEKLCGEFDKIKPELTYQREKLWTALPFYLRN